MSDLRDDPTAGPWSHCAEVVAERDRATRAIHVAKVVAESWRDWAMDHSHAVASHPLALVLAALDGEDNPDRLGMNPVEFEERLAWRWD